MAATGSATETLRAGGHRLSIGHPDKELFGRGGPTKRDLVRHYRAVAPLMLPHIRGRPLALERFPDGIEAEGFYQKRRPQHAPPWVRGVRVRRGDSDSTTMVVCDDLATLLWLADQAVVTPHPWLSRADDLRRPDRLIFDLDPPGDDFPAARRAAYDVREVLAELELACYVMTTGSRGVHVVVPIRPELDFDDVKELARGVADTAAARHPDRLTTRVRRNQRGGRLFVDILRNAYAQLAVAPYAVRPRPGAPVATPLEWAELDGISSARAWTLRTIGDRLDADPWHGMARHARSPRRALDRMARLARGR
ncbi:non-homologous end-joining DNA ligase [Marinitenerispora sediminis]|uniref:DNA polymerase domain-containing protein n=1 Tax=Marinitenerispora sediminis TaxID=1931232 RepID=A0A368T3D5_9ACTN|nr:non-homologous end-joining DNA ligase [Marinitenerispora sediminis]RCV49529.1 DNA polymerase domain-containing protein [Marinitenerispora sediminis]RCV55835.1 DNA polymerase domain-containing protein [Marinitenerispora sediminis]RCV56909.1 DNA polymerase domain-containing protein [Marinitenerispora sediminis]